LTAFSNKIFASFWIDKDLQILESFNEEIIRVEKEGQASEKMLEYSRELLDGKL